MGPIGFPVATSQSRAPGSPGLAISTHRPSELFTRSDAVDSVCNFSSSDFGETLGLLTFQDRIARSKPTVTTLAPSDENPTFFSPQGCRNGSPISWLVRVSQRRAVLSTAPPPVTTIRPSGLN